MLTLTDFIYILQGWYRAKVIEYNNETDNATLEFDTEKGNTYSYSIGKEVKANRPKLAKNTQRKVDDYENFFQIGAIVETKWTNEEAVDTNVLHGKLNQ